MISSFLLKSQSEGEMSASSTGVESAKSQGEASRKSAKIVKGNTPVRSSSMASLNVPTDSFPYLPQILPFPELDQLRQLSSPNMTDKTVDYDHQRHPQLHRSRSLGANELHSLNDWLSLAYQMIMYHCENTIHIHDNFWRHSVVQGTQAHPLFPLLYSLCGKNAAITGQKTNQKKSTHSPIASKSLDFLREMQSCIDRAKLEGRSLTCGDHVLDEALTQAIRTYQVYLAGLENSLDCFRHSAIDQLYNATSSLSKKRQLPSRNRIDYDFGDTTKWFGLQRSKNNDLSTDMFSNPLDMRPYQHHIMMNDMIATSNTSHIAHHPYDPTGNHSSHTLFADLASGMPHLGQYARPRENYSKEVVEVLKKWLVEHINDPYPSEEEKEAMCIQTGLRRDQVNNWFVNARRRFLPKYSSHHLTNSLNKSSSSSDYLS